MGTGEADTCILRRLCSVISLSKSSHSVSNMVSSSIIMATPVGSTRRKRKLLLRKEESFLHEEISPQGNKICLGHACGHFPQLILCSYVGPLITGCDSRKDLSLNSQLKYEYSFKGFSSELSIYHNLINAYHVFLLRFIELFNYWFTSQRFS